MEIEHIPYRRNGLRVTFETEDEYFDFMTDLPILRSAASLRFYGRSCWIGEHPSHFPYSEIVSRRAVKQLGALIIDEVITTIVDKYSADPIDEA